MTTPWRRVLVGLLLVLSALWVGPAYAHAALVRADPAPGSTVQAAPAQMTLEFTEELDPSFSAVRLIDKDSQTVRPGPGVVDSTKPTVLRLDLGSLPNGTYTAIWRVRSAADGHVTEGNVPFGVGEPVIATALIPPLGTPDPATLPPPPFDSLVRGLNYIALMLALGCVPFALLVWRPVARAVAPATAHDADAALLGMFRRTVVAGSVLLVAVALVFAVEQAATAADVPIVAAFGAPLASFFGTRTGLLLLVRMLGAALLAGLALRLPPPGQGSPRRWWAALLLGVALLLTFSLGGHAASERDAAIIAVPLIWLHLAAMVAWLGGLVPLGAALLLSRRNPDRMLPLARLIPRFSLLALVAVAVLTLTGSYSAWLQVGRLDLLALTTYGRALSVKLGLFALLLVLGAVNLLIVSPQLRKSGDRLARPFIQTIRWEVVLGVLLLLAVGTMTSVAPARTAWLEHQRMGIVDRATADDVDLTLRVAPALIGDNEFAVDVVDRRPGAADKPARVLINFGMVGMDMGNLRAETQSRDGVRFTSRGSYTTMAGRWQLEVVLRRAGFDDVTHTFEVDLLESSFS